MGDINNAIRTETGDQKSKANKPFYREELIQMAVKIRNMGESLTISMHRNA